MHGGPVGPLCEAVKVKPALPWRRHWRNHSREVSAGVPRIQEVEPDQERDEPQIQEVEPDLERDVS